MLEVLKLASIVLCNHRFGPSPGPREPEFTTQSLFFEGGSEQIPVAAKNHDRFVLDLEIEPGSAFVAVCDGASDGDGAKAAEAAAEATHDYVADEISTVMGDELGAKLLSEAIYVAHPRVEEATGTVNTMEIYEEGGTTTVALALIHPVESGGYELSAAASGDSLLRVFDREDDSLITLNPGDSENVLAGAVGSWSFGGIAGMTEGVGVTYAGNIPWKESYELIVSTDGLVLTDDEIVAIMKEYPEATEAAEALVESAEAIAEATKTLAQEAAKTLPEPSEQYIPEPDDITCVVVQGNQAA